MILKRSLLGICCSSNCRISPWSRIISPHIASDISTKTTTLKEIGKKFTSFATWFPKPDSYVNRWPKEDSVGAGNEVGFSCCSRWKKQILHEHHWTMEWGKGGKQHYPKWNLNWLIIKRRIHKRTEKWNPGGGGHLTISPLFTNIFARPRMNFWLEKLIFEIFPILRKGLPPSQHRGSYTYEKHRLLISVFQ